ncbi:hypothetical protein LSTR_LSTR005780 [Laodelphax striatellus]|uniref:BZIP domain-containing protein n=1 Tax=Laodelphax striatellus TaxID=195883 RepID=A0A482WX53_LAOST|nr:hypothetical protein LSTR_LSTR016796 [Laodelphax striatellus]RZF39152.1 hypothetical protein LSTR_LSTR005780 [Laodelphax striatellus]
MAKRRPNVSPYNVTSDLENDSGSEEISVSAKRRKSSESFVSSTVAYGLEAGRETIELTEENEHTYSCSPIIFTNSRQRRATKNSVSTTKKEVTGWKTILKTSSSIENVPSIGDSSSASDQDDDDDFTTDSRSQKSRRSRAKCFSKNAINARKNRMKKKQYVSNLEDDIKSLKTLKKALTHELNSKCDEIASLKNEVKYLRSIIANNSQIGSLLKRICTNDSIEIRSSVLQENSLQQPSSDSVCVKGTVNENVIPISTDNFDIPTGLDSISETDALLDSNLDILLDANLSSTAAPALDLPEMEEFLRCETPSKYLESLGDIQSDYGVCLHVGRNRISLEFCAACNENASNNWNSSMFD